MPTDPETKEPTMNAKIILYELAYQTSKYAERAAMAIAWAMPKWLVKWCAVRVWANATTGEHSAQDATELTFGTALQRWDTPNAD